MAKAKSQKDYRRSVIAMDQFGRPWLMQIELATGDPTGGIISAGWTDPLRTPLKFIRVPKDEFGQPHWGRCIVDVAAWMREVKAGSSEWLKNLYAAGTMQYKNKFNPATAEKDGYLLELAGPKPWPSLECLEALRTGNQHLAGQVKNEKGQSILDEKAKQLMEYQHTDLDPEPFDENEFNKVRAERAVPGLPDVDASMADEPAPTVTGTSMDDYQEFMRQAKASRMAYPAAIEAWGLHKEMVAQAG